MANTAKFQIWNTYLVSPVPLVSIPNNSRCPRTPACFFTCVRSAKFDFAHCLAIVACSARTVRYRVPQFRPDAPIAANRQQRTKASRSRSADNQQCSMNDSPAARAAILLIWATVLFHARKRRLTCATERCPVHSYFLDSVCIGTRRYASLTLYRYERGNSARLRGDRR